MVKFVKYDDNKAVIHSNIFILLSIIYGTIFAYSLRQVFSSRGIPSMLQEVFVTLREIETLIKRDVLKMADLYGIGTDFIEPYVLDAKIRLEKRPDGSDTYFWKQIPLLLVIVRRDTFAVVWQVCTPDGAVIREYTKTDENNEHSQVSRPARS